MRASAATEPQDKKKRRAEGPRRLVAPLCRGMLPSPFGVGGERKRERESRRKGEGWDDDDDGRHMKAFRETKKRERRRDVHYYEIVLSAFPGIWKPRFCLFCTFLDGV